MSLDGLSRGTPVQDLPENQDESVRYTIDEVTGVITPWDEPPAPKRRGRPPKEATPDAASEGAGE